jgi:hypothetical protein
MCRRGFFPAVAIALTVAICPLAVAQYIRYEWSGSLIAGDKSDPWNIGLAGATFDLQLNVSDTAADLHDLNVEFAAYEASSAGLTIDGDELTFVGPAAIDFTDNHAGLYDLVYFAGVFERSGQPVEFGTAITLPLGSYDLPSTVVPPPAFGIAVSPAGTSCCGGVYTAIVPSGALFSATAVIPEPTIGTMLAAVVLAVVGASRISGGTRRRRNS